MDFQQEYIEEVRQIIQGLEQSLMELEKSPNNPDEINNVYRYLHTVKGSAGMFGFHMMERLCHDLEFIYSDIRDGVRSQDDYILDLTLHAVDVLSELLAGDPNAEKDAEKLIASIKGLMDDSDAAGHTFSEISSQAGKSEAFAVLFTPEENIFKRGVNLQAILDDIHELSSVELIIHNEKTPLEKQIQSKKIESWFEVLTVTNGVVAIEDIFMFMKPTEFKIVKIENEDAFTGTEYAALTKLNAADIAYRWEKIKQWMPESVHARKGIADSTTSDAQLDEQEEITTIRRSSRKNGHVSVSTQKLDHLINIVSELVTFRSELQHIMHDENATKMSEAMEKLDYLTLKLRDSAFGIRLVPINILQVKLQRLVRSISQELGKEVDFITDGLETELDRSMINSLEAPLMHLIRNAIDHGIETPEEREKINKPRKGLLKLFSYNSGDHVFIQIQDDGKGIDFNKIIKKGIERGILIEDQKYTEKELIQVMMTPGFSTAEKVTTVSGRGVGMDVVKKDINALRGDVEVSTEGGLGTIFTLRLPLTLTVLDTLVVNVADNKYLIPINEVEYCYEERHEILYAKKSRQVNFKGQLTPFVSLREYFGEVEHPSEEIVIVVNKNDTRVAVVVDKIEGQLQTVYKPLNSILHGTECFAGTSILGDGSTALLLNALKLKN